MRDAAPDLKLPQFERWRQGTPLVDGGAAALTAVEEPPGARLGTSSSSTTRRETGDARLGGHPFGGRGEPCRGLLSRRSRAVRATEGVVMPTWLIWVIVIAVVLLVVAAVVAMVSKRRAEQRRARANELRAEATARA